MTDHLSPPMPGDDLTESRDPIGDAILLEQRRAKTHVIKLTAKLILTDARAVEAAAQALESTLASLGYRPVDSINESISQALARTIAATMLDAAADAI